MRHYIFNEIANVSTVDMSLKRSVKLFLDLTEKIVEC